MREEEKLARDVYLTLFDTWQQPIFSNIARSEETHTEAVARLMAVYGVSDPVIDDTVGVFTNPDLQALYDQLVADGMVSLTAALTVGATIEDLDIADLDEQLALTDKADIITVYENLQRGSRNHLRSFVSQLEQQGETYQPKYISAAVYTDIVSTDRERGGGSGSGGGQGHGQGNAGRG
jgi:hypothetical protein